MKLSGGALVPHVRGLRPVHGRIVARRPVPSKEAASAGVERSDGLGRREQDLNVASVSSDHEGRAVEPTRRLVRTEHTPLVRADARQGSKRSALVHHEPGDVIFQEGRDRARVDAVRRGHRHPMPSVGDHRLLGALLESRPSLDQMLGDAPGDRSGRGDAGSLEQTLIIAAADSTRAVHHASRQVGGGGRESNPPGSSSPPLRF
jgi:hypothetical protein